AGIVAVFEVTELRVAEGPALDEPIAARQQVGRGGVIVLDRKAEMMHAAGRHPIEKFRIGALPGDRLDHFELNVPDIAEGHAVIDGGGAAAEPAVFDND